MAIKTIVNNVKKIHKEDIVLVRFGNFYHAYGKDSYIISYFFGYKITEEDETYTCGFPINSINKVRAKLEEQKINYLILDRRNNYDVEEFCDNKNLNNYSKIYDKARKDATYMIRIEKIYNYMKQNVKKAECKEKILKVEKIINEE